MSKSRQNSNTPNRLSVADRTALQAKIGTRKGELVWQADIGLGYTWTTTQGIDNGGTIINVGTGSWVAHNGYTLYSPNGTKFVITVDDTGTLVVA